MLKVKSKMLAKRMVEAMLGLVNKHKLELMLHYPADLNLHDYNALCINATPGAKFAWVVGHTHTHLVLLGLDKNENDKVGYLISLSSSDKFFLIEVTLNSEIIFTEKSREQFNALSETPIPYSRLGALDDFHLMNGTKRVGIVKTVKIGNLMSNHYEVSVYPYSDITYAEQIALTYHANHAAINVAGSLFVKTEVKDMPSINAKLAA